MRASREHLENIHILPGCSKRLTSGSCGAAQSPISQQECRSRNKQTVDDARSWSFLLALLFSSTQGHQGFTPETIEFPLSKTKPNPHRRHRQ